jgi:hypothetical protein
VSGQLHALAALPLGKKPPWYPLETKLGGPQNLPGRRGKEKILDPYWDSNSDISVFQPIASCYTHCDAIFISWVYIFAASNLPSPSSVHLLNFVRERAE